MRPVEIWFVDRGQWWFFALSEREWAETIARRIRCCFGRPAAVFSFCSGPNV